MCCYLKLAIKARLKYKKKAVAQANKKKAMHKQLYVMAG